MMNPADDFFLPAELAALVDAELAEGERLTWIGQPIAGRLARSALPLALFGVPLTASTVFWISMAAWIQGGHPSGPGLFFPLFGIPFVLIGTGMLLSPAWAYRRARRTVYAITDRRALTMETDLWGRVVVRSYEPPDLTVLARVQYADGSGNLVLRREYRQNQGRGGPTGSFVDLGFLAVPDVKDVEERIRDLERKGSDSPSRFVH